MKVSWKVRYWQLLGMVGLSACSLRPYKFCVSDVSDAADALLCIAEGGVESGTLDIGPDAGTPEVGIEGGIPDDGMVRGMPDGSFRLGYGSLTTTGSSPEIGGSLRMFEHGFEFGARRCAGTLCETGGLVP